MNNNKNSELPPRLKTHDGFLEGNHYISNELNSHFVNIWNIVNKLEFHEENFSALQSKLDSELFGHEFDIAYITPFEVTKIIEKLDIKKSSGVCYGHKSSTGTVRRLFHQKSYDSTAPVRCPAGGRKNRTIFYHFFRHRTVPGEV